MNRTAFKSMTFITIALLAGCGAGNDGAQPSASSGAGAPQAYEAKAPQASLQPEPPASPAAVSPVPSSPEASASDAAGSLQPGEQAEFPGYYSPGEAVSLTISAEETRWEEGDVTLVFRKADRKIDSAVAAKGGRKLEIPLMKESRKPDAADAAALSPSRRYLAVEMSYDNLGYELSLADLDKGGVFSFNDMLRKTVFSKLEEVTSFNWSPDEDILAFAYGRIAELKPALYKAEDGSVIDLPVKQLYISLPSVMWSKDGKTIDYIAEYPSDQFKLYRYVLGEPDVRFVKDVPRSELKQYQSYVPPYLFQ